MYDSGPARLARTSKPPTRPPPAHRPPQPCPPPRRPRESLVPAFGDFSSFCIFIASITTTPCCSATSSPTATSTRTTRPGIGAFTARGPAAPAARPAPSLQRPRIAPPQTRTACRQSAPHRHRERSGTAARPRSSDITPGCSICASTAIALAIDRRTPSLRRATARRQLHPPPSCHRSPARPSRPQPLPPPGRGPLALLTPSVADRLLSQPQTANKRRRHRHHILRNVASCVAAVAAAASNRSRYPVSIRAARKSASIRIRRNNPMFVLIPPITYSSSARSIRSIAISRVSANATSFDSIGSYSSGTVQPA